MIRKVFVLCVMLAGMAGNLRAQWGIDAAGVYCPVNLHERSYVLFSPQEEGKIKGAALGIHWFKNERIMMRFGLSYTSYLSGREMRVARIATSASSRNSKYILAPRTTYYGASIEKLRLLGGEMDQKFYFYGITGFTARYMSLNLEAEKADLIQDARQDIINTYGQDKYTSVQIEWNLGYGLQYNIKTKLGVFADARVNLGYLIGTGMTEEVSMRVFTSLGLRTRFK